MLLHVTSKMATALQLNSQTDIKQDVILSTINPLHQWRGTYINEEGEQFILFMNDLTGFTLITTDVAPEQLSHITSLFSHALKTALLDLCVNEDIVKTYMQDLGSITYYKNTDRKHTAQLNARVKTVWHRLWETGDAAALMRFTNRIIYQDPNNKNNDLAPRMEMLNRLFESYDGPIMKVKALDLTIKLVYEEKEIIRSVRVSEHMSFSDFHQLIQICFNWQNTYPHLFHFYEPGWQPKVIDKWGVVLSPHHLNLISDSHSSTKDSSHEKISTYFKKYTHALYIYNTPHQLKCSVTLNKTHTFESDKIPILPALLFGLGDPPPETLPNIDPFNQLLNHDHPDNPEEQPIWRQPYIFERTEQQIKAHFDL